MDMSVEDLLSDNCWLLDVNATFESDLVFILIGGFCSDVLTLGSSTGGLPRGVRGYESWDMGNQSRERHLALTWKVNR